MNSNALKPMPKSINDLPDELLTKIFEILLDGENYESLERGYLNLAFVSRRFFHLSKRLFGQINKSRTRRVCLTRVWEKEQVRKCEIHKQPLGERGPKDDRLVWHDDPRCPAHSRGGETGNETCYFKQLIPVIGFTFVPVTSLYLDITRPHDCLLAIEGSRFENIVELELGSRNDLYQIDWEIPIQDLVSVISKLKNVVYLRIHQLPLAGAEGSDEQWSERLISTESLPHLERNLKYLEVTREKSFHKLLLQKNVKLPARILVVDPKISPTPVVSYLKRFREHVKLFITAWHGDTNWPEVLHEYELDGVEYKVPNWADEGIYI